MQSAGFDIDNPCNPTLTLRIILNELKPVLTVWFKLGLQLGITHDELKAIELENWDTERRLVEMIALWLKKDTQRSWKKLIRCLEKVDQNNLARAVKSRCTTGQIEREYHKFMESEENLLTSHLGTTTRSSTTLLMDNYQRQFESDIARFQSGHRQISRFTFPQSSGNAPDDFRIPHSSALDGFLTERDQINHLLSITDQQIKGMQANLNEERDCIKLVIKGRKELNHLEWFESFHEERIQLLRKVEGKEEEVRKHQEKLKLWRKKIKDTKDEVQRLEEGCIQYSSSSFRRGIQSSAARTQSLLRSKPITFEHLHKKLIEYIAELKCQRQKLEAPIQVLEATISRDGKLVGSYAAEGFNYGDNGLTKVLWGGYGAVKGGFKAIKGGSGSDEDRLRELRDNMEKINGLVSQCEQYAKECLKYKAICEQKAVAIQTTVTLFAE